MSRDVATQQGAARPAAGSPPLRLAPAEPRHGAHWQPLADLAGIEDLLAVPIGDKELLNLSQALPIAVSLGDAGLHVAAILHPALLRRPAVMGGAWRLAYKPLAIRALPFFPINPATGAWASMLIEHAEPRPGARQPAPEPYLLPDGGPAPALARATQVLLQLIGGARRLQHAAEALLAADLLAPLVPAGSAAPAFARRSLLVTDPARMARLTPVRLHALARDGMLPLDLMVALHFSQRLLAETVGRASADGAIMQASQPLEDPAALPADLAVEGFGLDASPLFSFEALLAARHPAGQR